jgi:hypothetical protein
MSESTPPRTIPHTREDVLRSVLWAMAASARIPVERRNEWTDMGVNLYNAEIAAFLPALVETAQVFPHPNLGTMELKQGYDPRVGRALPDSPEAQEHENLTCDCLSLEEHNERWLDAPYVTDPTTTLEAPAGGGATRRHR